MALSLLLFKLEAFMGQSKKLILSLLALSLLGLAACAKSGSSAVRVAGRQGGAGSGVIPQEVASHQCSSGQTTTGKIFDSYGNSANFERQVKAFISATMSPENFGTISGVITDSTGVDMVGSFKFDSSGNLLLNESAVLIKIFDSYTNQTYNGSVVQPYTIQFSAAASGYLDRTTKQFRVKFADSYGEIEFQGRYDNNNANSVSEGTVSFVNHTAVSGYTPASGVLGTFRAYTCALIIQ